MGNSECGIKRGGRESSSTKDFSGESAKPFLIYKFVRFFHFLYHPTGGGAVGGVGGRATPPPRLRRGEISA